MNSRPNVLAGFGPLAPLHSIVTAIVLLSVAAPSAQAAEMSVGAAEQIYTKSKRSKRGGSTWPDGNLGVVPLGNGMYDFYGANGSKPVKTTGTLLDPGTGKKSVKITNLPKKTFNYVAGGPVYHDEASGARLMIYHAEKHGKSAKDFYSVLGLAVSTDPAGRVFSDLGTIVEPNLQTGQAEVGGGTFAVMDGQLHVYYRDVLSNGWSSELAVARASLTDVVSNALTGQGTQFSKYHNGSWSQPGKGGLSSPLEVGNPSNGWASVSYNDYLDELVMVSSQWGADKPDLYLATSADGINWSSRMPVAVDPGEQFYPTLIGTGADPQRTGQSFYVYYTDSKKGAWSRWKDAKLMRREITFDPFTGTVDPSFPPSEPNSPPQDPMLPPDPGPMDWAQISDFTSDFRSGGPAQGWKYAWNPNGKVTDSNKFAPLVWSDIAQAYNTTGVETMLPTKKSHKDDYLHLSAAGGHTGKKKYFPIAGYTIQDEDGAGLYRLVDSSISKGDGLLSSKEDGLQVLVYVDNQRIGVPQAVSTNGLVTGFDRELGELNVGDTVWVMVDPLKNHYYDSFTAFDFSLQKLLPSGSLAFAASVVPEPTSAALLLLAVAGLGLRRPRQWCRRRGRRARLQVC